MSLPAPAALVAPAPHRQAPTLEGFFAVARAAARRAADPRAVLASDSATLVEKLAAIDAIHARLPAQSQAARRAAIGTLAAATGPRQPPEVRAKALTHLGYAVPLIEDERTRAAAVETLLSAAHNPLYRLYALRGLGPASHGLPESHEEVFQQSLLDLLDGPVVDADRATLLVALYAFISSRDDLPLRKPALLDQLDARLLATLEASPEDFVADPRGSEHSRQMTAAVLWSAARHRKLHGDSPALTRLKDLFDRWLAVETSPSVRGWLERYRRDEGTDNRRESGASTGY